MLILCNMLTFRNRVFRFSRTRTTLYQKTTRKYEMTREDLPLRFLFNQVETMQGFLLPVGSALTLLADG